MEPKKAPNRHLVSLKPECEGLIFDVVGVMRKDLPQSLSGIKISKTAAIETALRFFLKEHK